MSEAGLWVGRLVGAVSYDQTFVHHGAYKFREALD